MQSTSASDTPFTRNRWSVRTLIVDDDAPIRELLCGYLPRFNIEAVGVDDGQAMRLALAEERFDVVMLDLMLPGEDGLSLCRWLRAKSDIPILMLAARCEPADRIIALGLGADDYLAKPFEPREMVARIQTILRRVRDDRDTPHADSRSSSSAKPTRRRAAPKTRGTSAWWRPCSSGTKQEPATAAAAWEAS